jgi:hypothetical protein
MKRSFTVMLGASDGVEAFLGVARHHSFRKAADELGVTKSAVSQAIRALEARVGVALFIRTTRSVCKRTIRSVIGPAWEITRALMCTRQCVMIGSHGSNNSVQGGRATAP